MGLRSKDTKNSSKTDNKHWSILETILTPQRRTQGRNRWNLLEKVLTPKYMVDGVEDDEDHWEIRAKILSSEETTESEEEDMSLSVSVKIVQKKESEGESELYESWNDLEAARWRQQEKDRRDYSSGSTVWGAGSRVAWCVWTVTVCTVLRNI